MRLINLMLVLYQIRAKRVGRQRLFTKQAWIKNRDVLLAMKATVVGVACGVVMLVFNFFLSVWVKRQIKGIQFYFSLINNAKLNDKVL